LNFLVLPADAGATGFEIHDHALNVVPDLRRDKRTRRSQYPPVPALANNSGEAREKQRILQTRQQRFKYLLYLEQ
jgi:hypothetical protein